MVDIVISILVLLIATYSMCRPPVSDSAKYWASFRHALCIFWIAWVVAFHQAEEWAREYDETTAAAAAEGDKP